MVERTKYRTVVISDVHLGAPHSKLEEVTDFLNSIDCERLILAGDIIDGWQLSISDDQWDERKSMFCRAVFRISQRNKAKVIYVAGNHDDFLDAIIPCELFGISIVSKYILESGDKRYVVIHGHAFDSITAQFRWISKLGDVAYNLLIKFNNWWNRHRQAVGKETYSFSKVIKQKVKQAVNYISGFETDLSDYAKSVGCDGIICGHIHRAEDKMLKGGIRYLNSGDWVESKTALLEDFEGNWSIYRYQK